MSRTRVLRIARITGHVAWWVFVVAALCAGGITWWQQSPGVEATFTGDFGWTAYAPLTGDDTGNLVVVSPGSAHDAAWQTPGVYSLIAFVVLVVAALCDATTAGRLIPGVITVLVPVVALGLFVLATPGIFAGFILRGIAAMGLILLAVAIREVWMRRFAPGTTELRRSAADPHSAPTAE